MIPRPALYLGLAGLIPFIVAAALIALQPSLTLGGAQVPLLPYGQMVMLSYGQVILAFMSGVLWGFAAQHRRARFWPYAASVAPALWVFFTAFLPDTDQDITLTLGFVALLVLDFIFARASLAPPWWMQLRLILTGIVMACLAVSLYFG